MKRKILSIVLSLAMVLTMIPCISDVAFAEDDTDYLCFTAEQDNSSVQLIKKGDPEWDANLQYSTDLDKWQGYSIGEDINISNAGDSVYFRSSVNNRQGFSSKDNYYHFVMKGKIAASGNIMSLISDGSESLLSIPCAFCFYALFENCHSLTAAPELPATQLAAYCYGKMFSYCSNLIYTPYLPSTDLAEGCYFRMFEYCTSLGAPLLALRLPATNLPNRCYYRMFRNSNIIVKRFPTDNVKYEFKLPYGGVQSGVSIHEGTDALSEMFFRYNEETPEIHLRNTYFSSIPSEACSRYPCSLEKIEQCDPTCKNSGHKEYWQCTECRSCYSDSNGKNPIISIGAWKTHEGKIPALGHEMKWCYDENGHYRICIRDCGKLTDNGLHTWGTGEDADKCTVCGYVKQADSEGHVHKFDTAWSRNSEYHWHAATCGCSDIVGGFSKHVYSPTVKYDKGVKIQTCTKCNYQKKTTMKVTVPKTSIKSVKRARKAFTVKWTKKSVTGYEIQYATNSKFTKGKKTIKVTKAGTVSKKISKLKAKKRYYVKVRCYTKKYGKTYYSGWSAKKAVTTK